MSWDWHAPSGTYKNHALSGKIREEAVSEAVFMKYVSTEPGYGKKRGDTVTIQRVRALALAGRVSDTERLPSIRPAVETGSITVSEWGNKIELTEFEQNLSNFDLKNKFQKALKDQMKLTMDKMVADAMKQTYYKFTPHATAGTDDSAFDTDGTPSVTANINLGVAHLRQIHDELRRLKVPYHSSGRYIGVLSTRAARGIKNDPEYKDWQAPTTSEPFMSGRLNDVEGFMLVETNHDGSLDDTSGASTTLGDAIFFGDDAATLAVVEDPELRVGLPEDLGRFYAVGWVGTLEAGLTWPADRPSTQRAIHVTSA